MIDIALLRSDPGLVRRTVEQRGADVDVDVDRIVEIDAQLREATARFNTLRTQQRRQSMSREPADPDAAQAVQDELRTVTDEVRELQELRDEQWARVPNLLPPDTPAGDDDSGNVELRRVGDTVAPDDARRHDAVGTSLGILDPGTAAQVASCWHGDGARLAWAVFTHAQSVLQARGFTPMLTPPGTREELIGYYGDQVLDTTRLPIRVSAFSSAQSHAVEQLVLCRPEDSEGWLDDCQRNAEEILRDLELPYRVVRVCVGDLDASAHKGYHTECWFPGAGDYRLTHSAANLTDYQARRFRIRYLERGRVAQPHTVSVTGITELAVLALLENHLQPAGAVRIPAALRPYLGGQELIEPKLA